MTTLSKLSIMIIVVSAVIFTAGCELNDDSSSRSSYIGPDLQGRWSGQYYVLDSSNSDLQEITATISHTGNKITLKTSKQEIGNTFEGIIDEEGHIGLTDLYDGEIWTTFFGPAETDHIIIADYLMEYDTTPGSDTPIAVIELWR